MNIYLIGMPLSGKSSIGRMLAKQLNKPFIDLDHKVEVEYSMFVDEIFKNYGEGVFRTYETKVLESVKELDAVISCGGGIVEKKSNKALMNGLKIYLETPVETLKVRQQFSHARPLLATMSLEQLYDKRFLKYRDFADVIVANNDKFDKTIHDIMNVLQEKGLL